MVLTCVVKSAFGTVEVVGSSGIVMPMRGVKPPMTRTEEEIGDAELAAPWKAVSNLAASLMWRTGQSVDVPVPQVVEEEAVGEVVVELAVLSGEAVSSGPGECALTSAAATAAAKPVVEARRPGITENSAPTESVCTVSPCEAGFYGSSSGGRDRASATGIVQSVGEVRSPGFVECSGTEHLVMKTRPGLPGPERMARSVLSLLRSMSMEPDLCVLRGAVPRQSAYSQFLLIKSLLMNLGLHGPEQVL